MESPRCALPHRPVWSATRDAINDTYVAEVARRWNLHDRHHLTAGGSVRQDRFDITIAPADRGRFDAAAFIEDQIR